MRMEISTHPVKVERPEGAAVERITWGPSAKAVIGQPTLLLTVEETARELRIARRRVFAMIQDGRLPSVKIGRSRRVRSTDLAEYVAGLGGDDAA